MSKHASADQKLHVSPPVQPQTATVNRKLTPPQSPSPEVRSKKTNSINQYR